MPVSRDAFSDLPRPPGWKYERWDGCLRLEPDWRYEIARWTSPLPKTASPRADVRLSPADAASAESLFDLADRAFAHGPDFFAAPDERRREHLRDAITDALDLEPDWVRRAGQAAWPTGGELIGLSGVGSSLLAGVVQALPDAVDLRSAWLVANRESAGWHARNGFQTVPTSVSRRSLLTAEMWGRRATLRTRIEAEPAIREQEDAERAGHAPDPFSFARPIHRRPSA